MTKKIKFKELENIFDYSFLENSSVEETTIYDNGKNAMVILKNEDINDEYVYVIEFRKIKKIGENNE